MAVTVSMPQLGETVTEGTILSWAKKPGDSISEDEVLLEISTDKVDAEIPSPAAGIILEILVPEGDTVAVGTPLVVIATEGEQPNRASAEETPEPAVSSPDADPPADPPQAAGASSSDSSPAVQPEPAAPKPIAPAEIASPADGTATGGSARRGVLSPVVRKLAVEHDLDLNLISGSGEGGRITRKDVMRFIELGRSPGPAAKVTLEPAPETPIVPATSADPTSPSATAQVAQAPAPEALSSSVEPGGAVSSSDDVVKLTRLRQRIAENMVSSRRTAAHVWTSVEVDYESVERVRQRHRAAFKEEEGFSLTYLPFIARATMDALHAYPIVNSSLSLDEGTVTHHGGIHLGVAVDLNEDGLLVATVRDADQMRMTGLAREVRRLASKARAGTIGLDDIGGSTFTLTNPGPFGSLLSAPIINVPNVGILSTETVVKRPTVVALPDGSDSIAIHHIGYLCFSWDHRAFDGSTALLFLNRVKDNLETWDWEQELS
jgi:pyruvate dehydrogenase E2 component (dihydrolipoamide acetyltransferase)